MAAPALVALGSLRGRRGLIAAGVAGSALGTAVFEDVARSPIVPGANDNLTAVAVLVALAERLRDAAGRRPARASWPPAAPRRSSRAASTASPAATSRRSIAIDVVSQPRDARLARG